MHIKPAEPGTGRLKDSGTSRKLRLGGAASRVPARSQTKVTDTPMKSFVTAIGQTIGSRTPLRGQNYGSRTPLGGQNSASRTPLGGQNAGLNTPVGARNAGSSRTPLGGQNSGSRTPSVKAKSSLFSSSAAKTSSSTTPADSRLNSSAARLSAAVNSSRIPSTPQSSRTQAIAGTPSRRSSLSSSSSSSSSSISTSNVTIRKQSISSSTPTSVRRAPATPSTSSRNTVPATPVTKKSSILPPRTPNAQNNPTTPSSKASGAPHPTPRRPAVSSTPGAKQISTPQTRSKGFLPTTPVSKHPTTPVHGENGFSTPYTHQGSNSKQAFYTPNSTLPLTPLQPKNFNVPESSRRLHFGINVAAMADQENLGNQTPKPNIVSITEATFSFDKNRLAQIKARKNVSQLLRSPAQRVMRTESHHPPSHTPGRLQQLAEDRSARFDEDGLVQNLNLTHSPARRRVANSLF